MNTLTNVKGGRSERVEYNAADFPAYIRRDALSAYPNYTAVSHWHDDVEFIAVLSGYMQYNVNGEIVRLDEGNGIFVNARQLHYGFCDDRSECRFICVLLHPVLLCSSHYLERKFVAPVITDGSLPFRLLHRNTAWERKILTGIQEMYECLSERTSELKIQSLFYDIWYELCRHGQTSSPLPVVRSHHLSALKDMIAYIQEHYKDKVSLCNIANAGNVGKTSCCMIFQRYISQTPISYLTVFRLQKSAELLTSSDLTIAEICYEVGFSGGSYFTESFRNNFGCSPSEYRKKAKK